MNQTKVSNDLFSLRMENFELFIIIFIGLYLEMNSSDAFCLKVFFKLDLYLFGK